MTTLRDLDKTYLGSVTATYDQLQKVFHDIRSNYKFDLSKLEISEVILERLKAYYITQGKIKTFLDKRYLAAASDYFVESVLFFLRLYLLSMGGELQAHSERQIRGQKIRSDPIYLFGKKMMLLQFLNVRRNLDGTATIGSNSLLKETQN
jgi:hypothetical protein